METVIKKLNVVAAVLADGSKFFAAKRPDSTHLGGKWEFPGGKIEEGETHEEAITREMKEEFLVDITVGTFIGDVLHQYPDKLIHLFFYAVEISGGELTPVEHPAVGWFDFDGLLKADLAGGDMVFAEKFLRDYTS